MKLNDALIKLTSTNMYDNTLFYNDGQFFIIYDNIIAYRDDPGNGYEGIYKVTENTYKLIEKYCEKKEIDLSDLGTIDLEEYLGGGQNWDNDSVKSLLRGGDLDYDTEEFIKYFIKKGSVLKVYKAVDMMINNCDVDQWYMDFGYSEYISIIDSIVIESDLLKVTESFGEIEETWLGVISDIESFTYSIKDGGIEL